jgi:hypothetical protein
MKTDDKTRVQQRFGSVKRELHILGQIAYRMLTFKLAWQYYAIGAMLWIDGMVAGWLICSDLF